MRCICMSDRYYDNLNIQLPVEVKDAFYRTMYRYMETHPKAKVWEFLKEAVDAIAHDMSSSHAIL